MRKLRIVVADDHTLIRTGLRSVIEREADMEVVAEAADGRQAVQLCCEMKPDIAVLDIGMPGLNGLEAAAQITKMDLRIHLVILSMHSDETYINRALTAGVKGYLLKDSAESDVVDAIRAVADGRTYLTPKVSEAFIQDSIRHLHQRHLEDSLDLLSGREREVLQLVAEGRANKEIATALGVSVTTVETHRNHLMQKLNLHSTAEVVLYAVRKKIIS